MTSTKNRLHNVLIIGATPAGLAAANKLGELGIPVTLVDRATDLDQKLSDEVFRLDSGVPFNFAHRPGLIRILRNPGIRCFLPAEIRSVRHNPQGFNVRIEPQGTFIAQDRCTLCGQCVAACPVGCDTHSKPIKITSRRSLPGRAVIDKRQPPLCQSNCPLGVNAQGYVALAKAGLYQEALDLVRQNNVLPGICGRVCNHPCETACRRAEVDAPVAIRDIKRYVADHGKASPRIGSTPARTERVAVIGSGPAGLAAAVDLARRGFDVTIFEKQQEAGGLLRYGIGPHRLPREILDRELADIGAEGVKIVTNHPVSLDQDLEVLQKEFSAVLVATGSWADRRLGVPGEDLASIEGCLAFLGEIYNGSIKRLNENVAVIGDGNAAFDLARALIRLGAKVTIVSWFGRSEIPADAEEVSAALQEGIAILDRRRVIAFNGDNGRLTSLRVQATRPGPAGDDGIAWPEVIPGAEPLDIAFDRALVAIGQTGAYSPAAVSNSLEISAGGFITADSSGRTSLKQVYAAGDAVSGASTVVQAMAAGRRAAAGVILDLDSRSRVRKGQAVNNPLQPARPDNRDFMPIDPNLAVQGRTPMPEISVGRRQGNFNEVMLGYDDDQVRIEASRCLQCGGCSECMQCFSVCQTARAIRHDQLSDLVTENAGVLIVADPEMAPDIKGEDVIRAYAPPSAKPDVNAMMLRGFAAAARAMVLIKESATRLKGRGISFVRPDPGLADSIRIGVFACRCNDSFGWSDDMSAYLESLTGRHRVVHVEEIASACISEGINTILSSVRDKELTRIVLASCVCCPLNYVCSACTDQRSRLKQNLFNGTGISRSMVQTCNLRGEALNLTHKNPDLAFTLFKGLIHRSIGRAAKLLPFPKPVRAYNFTSAVIGDSEAAQDSAMTLAEVGLEVLMFGTSKNPLQHFPEHPNVIAFKDSAVTAVSGTLGEFKVHVDIEAEERVFTVGGVILGEKSRNIALYRHHSELPNLMVQSSTQKEDVPGIPFMYPGATSISGLFLADPPGVQISKHIKGAAAAVLATAAMARSPRQSRGLSVVINESLCRGCGRCLKVCPYQAVVLKNTAGNMLAAVVDEALCKGCGNCISVCPSNAADSPFRDQVYLERTIEELLTGEERI